MWFLKALIILLLSFVAAVIIVHFMWFLKVLIRFLVIFGIVSLVIFCGWYSSISNRMLGVYMKEVFNMSKKAKLNVGQNVILAAIWIIASMISLCIYCRTGSFAVAFIMIFAFAKVMTRSWSAGYWHAIYTMWSAAEEAQSKIQNES